MVLCIWPNPSEIRQSVYGYVIYDVEIKIFMFYSKKYYTFFFFFVSLKFYTFSDAEKYRENSYIMKKIFQCNFQTAMVSQVF